MKILGHGNECDRGEETIFLRDCLKKGLKIRFVNKKIASVNQENSSWFKGFNKDFLYKQSKVFKRMYPKIYKLVILQFVIRKYNLYKSNVKFIEALKLMLKK